MRQYSIYSEILSLDRYVAILKQPACNMCLNENLHTKIQHFIATQNAHQMDIPMVANSNHCNKLMNTLITRDHEYIKHSRCEKPMAYHMYIKAQPIME